MITFLNTSAAAAPLVIRAKPGLAPFTPKIPTTRGAAINGRRSRRRRRACPIARIRIARSSTSRTIRRRIRSASITTTRSRGRASAHYFNVVRAGSSVSNPSAVLLDTGEALKVETISGAELKKRGLDAGEPVTDTTQIVVISFPAVKTGQSVRLRITETYTDPNRYLLDGDELVWDRAFGRPRNTRRAARGMDGGRQLDAGLDHAGSRWPAAAVFREQPERRDPGVDSRPPRRGRAVMVEESIMKKWLATSCSLPAACRRPAAQSLDPITAEDTLKVQTATVLDLSEDGRFVAIGVRRLVRQRRDRTIAATAIRPTSRRRWSSCR